MVVLALGMSASANAKECLTESITTKGKMKITKFMAYPSSLFAWRRAVNNTHGPAYHSWRRAENRDIDCAKVYNAKGKKRWQCTRTARPCAKNGSGGGSHNHGGDTNYDTPPYPGHVMETGHVGDDVKVLQQLLDDAGYYVDVDGEFGYKTRTAVKAFQKAEAIQVDGVVGRETWDRLAG